MSEMNFEQYVAHLQGQVKKLVRLEKFIIDELKAASDIGNTDAAKFSRHLLQHIAAFDPDDT